MKQNGWFKAFDVAVVFLMLAMGATCQSTTSTPPISIAGVRAPLGQCHVLALSSVFPAFRLNQLESVVQARIDLGDHDFRLAHRNESADVAVEVSAADFSPAPTQMVVRIENIGTGQVSRHTSENEPTAIATAIMAELSDVCPELRHPMDPKPLLVALTPVAEAATPVNAPAPRVDKSNSLAKANSWKVTMLPGDLSNFTGPDAQATVAPTGGENTNHIATWLGWQASTETTDRRDENAESVPLALTVTHEAVVGYRDDETELLRIPTANLISAAEVKELSYPLPAPDYDAMMNWTNRVEDQSTPDTAYGDSMTIMSGWTIAISYSVVAAVVAHLAPRQHYIDLRWQDGDTARTVTFHVKRRDSKKILRALHKVISAKQS
ncbi:MAG TPA: hypothetical protein VEI49_13230 [Terriglobales bacterium]|nr:hypothetical protein [Terriglobales bacterium]